MQRTLTGINDEKYRSSTKPNERKMPLAKDKIEYIVFTSVV